ncbi:hypothetical protein HaLaN_23221, partial [Haematococcus lacustris]
MTTPVNGTWPTVVTLVELYGQLSCRGAFTSANPSFFIQYKVRT